jgi:hypothetical protein
MSALEAEFYANGLDARYLGGAKHPVKDGEVIYAGAMIALVDGEWENVTATTGLEGRVCRARDTVDNTDDGKYLEGLFLQHEGKWLTPLYNDEVAPIVQASMGSEVYFVDNQTVSIDDTGRSRAGRVWAFAPAHAFDTGTSIVWVEVY